MRRGQGRERQHPSPYKRGGRTERAAAASNEPASEAWLEETGRDGGGWSKGPGEGKSRRPLGPGLGAPSSCAGLARKPDWRRQEAAPQSVTHEMCPPRRARCQAAKQRGRTEPSAAQARRASTHLRARSGKAGMYGRVWTDLSAQ